MAENIVKDVSSQTLEERMYVIKLISYQMLGAKWKYYRKIIQGGKGLKIFREASMLEHMKATRAALLYTTKNTKNLYCSVYHSCVGEIKKYTKLRDCFAEIPEVEGDQVSPQLTEDHDALIITWTPLKFLNPLQKIRERGKSTQRHTEGLVAKLYFKVAAFYSIQENWDQRKLSFYLRNINSDSSYQDIVSALEPLKTDLQTFTGGYEIFKFGKASLSRDVASDLDAFDDAMSDESFESQVRTLYWYGFIYQALEQFIIKYYLTLVTSTASVEAIAYLTNIFEPAIAKATANRIVFHGSFETDQSKRAFRKPYYDYVKKAWSEPLKKKIKTKKGFFESHNFNQRLIKKHQIDFDPPADPNQGSNWGIFLKHFVLATLRPIISIDLTDPFYEDPEELTMELEKLTDINTRSFLALQIFRAMIAYATQKQNARFTVLNRFKKQIKADSEMEVKRIAEIRKNGDDKIRDFHRKLSKYKRLKQFEMVEQVSRDITQFKDNLEKKISRIDKSSRENMILKWSSKKRHKVKIYWNNIHSQIC